MADGAHPRVSRRREVSHASARSVLMTVLGEYVLPRRAPVWTSTVVEVLALFGVEEKSARQALSRTAAEGWLRSERVGRRVRWCLTAPGHRLLAEGAHRVSEFGREQGDWDGRWLMLFVTVPEAKRDLRHRVRTRLTWSGFGSPQPGVWVSPDTRRQAEAARIIAELGVESPVMSFVAEFGSIGEVDDLVARAWDLSDLTLRYQDFIDEFSGVRPTTGQNALHAQTLLVHEWRRFPFLDPDLPSVLLPENWTGAKAAELFHSKHHEWRAASQRHWDDVLA
ncbi:PaaX family transcriptional regulator C-terminal domain-containing protein [Umezawaea sp.]|uniref:PaaX family transcriptional regulator n=1 Tax=Umezawaea sp. TaxID=1955258 RepID=UPI002ED08F79